MDSRKECEKYYGVDWSSSLIKWGQPIMEGRIVRTKDPAFDVHPSVREALAKEILFPDTTMPSQRVTQSDIQQMKDLMELSFESKVTSMRQIRILFIKILWIAGRGICQFYLGQTLALFH